MDEFVTWHGSKDSATWRADGGPATLLELIKERLEKYARTITPQTEATTTEEGRSPRVDLHE
jgi:hypothetical protein